MSGELDQSSARYARAIDLGDRNNPHTLAVLLVDEGSRVLDIGTATGSVAAALHDRGSKVWGVEIDKEAADEAAKVCEQVVVGDVEQLDLYKELDQHEFDWLLFLDVLEHLRDPLETLGRCVRLLAPGGRVLVSLPNVAHASVRLRLLRGRFEYTATGLLDHTHLRFFDERSMRELMAAANLTIEDEFPIRRTPEQEMGDELGEISPDLSREIDADPTSDIYQFVIVAGAASSKNGGGPAKLDEKGGEQRLTLSSELWKRVNTLERLVREGEGHTRSLTDQISEFKRRTEHVESLESLLLERDGLLAERMNELHVRDREIKHLRLDLSVKESTVVELRKRLADAKAETDAARAEADVVISLRERIEALEWELTQALKRLEYGRYRAADRVSAVIRGLPGVHRLARFVVEAVFRGRH